MKLHQQCLFVKINISFTIYIAISVAIYIRIPISIRTPLQILSSTYPSNCLLNSLTSPPLHELISSPDGETIAPKIRGCILSARSGWLV